MSNIIVLIYLFKPKLFNNFFVNITPISLLGTILHFLAIVVPTCSAMYLKNSPYFSFTNNIVSAFSKSSFFSLLIIFSTTGSGVITSFLAIFPRSDTASTNLSILFRDVSSCNMFILLIISLNACLYLVGSSS